MNTALRALVKIVAMCDNAEQEALIREAYEAGRKAALLALDAPQEIHDRETPCDE